MPWCLIRYALINLWNISVVFVCFFPLIHNVFKTKVFLGWVFAGHVGSTESNHGPTSGLQTLVAPESAAVIAVCCEAQISEVRTDLLKNKKKKQAARRTRRPAHGPGAVHTDATGLLLPGVTSSSFAACFWANSRVVVAARWTRVSATRPKSVQTAFKSRA